MRDSSEVRLTYHESGRRKLSTDTRETYKGQHSPGNAKGWPIPIIGKGDCWCPEVDFSEEHEQISNCIHNESQRVDRKRKDAQQLMVQRDFSELG